MNNLFLNHLKSISPEGRDAETRLFVENSRVSEDFTTSAREREWSEKMKDAKGKEEREKVWNKRSDERQSKQVHGKGGKVLKRKVKHGDTGNDEWLGGMPVYEATQSKVSKARAGINPNKDYPTLKKTEDKYATRLKAREAAMLRRGGADQETIRKSVEDPGGDYGRPEAQIARNRFTTKSMRSRDAGKKSPRNQMPVNEKYDILKKKKPSQNKNILSKGIASAAKKVGKAVYKALATPQHRIDAMITGRNF